MTTIPDKGFFKTWEVAKILGIPKRTVQNWLQTGRIKGERHGIIGRLWWIPRSELERLASRK